MKPVVRTIFLGVLLSFSMPMFWAQGAELAGRESDSLDPLPSWIDTTFYRDMVGGMRFSGWPVMEEERRNDLLLGKPVKGLLPPHRPYVQAPSTSSEVIRVLAWHASHKTYYPWQAKDPDVPRYDTAHRVLAWIQFNDSAGTKLWFLIIASLQRNSHLGNGSWILPSLIAFQEPWTFRRYSEIRDNDSLQEIIKHPASEEYRQFLRSRNVHIKEARLYDHPPSNAEITSFLLDYGGGSYDDPRTPALFDPFARHHEGYIFLKGSVRSRTWSQVTGEDAPFSFPER